MTEIEGTLEVLEESLCSYFKVAVDLCKYLGFTVFSVQPNGELHFAYKSLPFTAGIIKTIIVVISLLIFNKFSDQLYKLYKFDDQTATERFCTEVVSLNAFVTDSLILLFVFLRRKFVIDFHRLLINFFIQYATDPRDIQLCCDSILKMRRKLVTFQTIIVNVFLLHFGVCMMYTVVQLTDLSWNNPEESWFFLIMPYYTFFYNTLSLLRFAARLYVISLILCFQTAAVLLQSKIRRLEIQKSEVARFLRMVTSMEELVNSFNDAFGLTPALNVFSLVSSQITYIFIAIVGIQNLDIIETCQFATAFFLSSVIVYAFCNSGFIFSREVPITNTRLH